MGHIAQLTQQYTYKCLRAGERTGRPLGDGCLPHRLEALLGRRIHRHKPGPNRCEPAHEMSIVSPQFPKARPQAGQQAHRGATRTAEDEYCVPLIAVPLQAGN